MQHQLSVEDITFEGEYGSKGATIEKAGENHFRIALSHVPGHPDWACTFQCVIAGNARGNAPRFDVLFKNNEDAYPYPFDEYFVSYSYDNETWHSVMWEKNADTGYPKPRGRENTLHFPAFKENVVYIGGQVPMSHEVMMKRIAMWQAHEHVRVQSIGKSAEGRDIPRVTIENASSSVPREKKWVFHLSTQHPMEGNAKWRLAGMVDYYLSDEAREFRTRSILYAVPMMAPDGAAHGWHRVNSAGVDMNRAYRAEGANEQEQSQEAYVNQKDFEALMASDARITALFSLHTWPGAVEPVLKGAGPEMGTTIPSWTVLRDTLARSAPSSMMKPLAFRETADDAGANNWSGTPHARYGISLFLVEGGGALYTKGENIESGRALMRAIADYYTGTRL